MGGELIRSDLSTDETRGFTLIELLVVIAVVSVLAVGAVLTAARDRSNGDNDAATFRMTYNSLRAMAVHSQRPQALFVTARGHRKAQRHAGEWQLSDHAISWRTRVVFSPIGHQTEYGVPQLIFLPNGQTSAFSVTFSGDSKAHAIRCAGNGWAEMQCAPG